MYYTIQNDNGDRGFIQKIDLVENKEHDEVMGYVTSFNLENADCYLIIDKLEYDAILNLYHVNNIHGHHNNVLADLIDSVIAANEGNELADLLF